MTNIHAPHQETFQPAPVKKRRAASMFTAGVAGVAGLALAATAFTFIQPGSATAAPEVTEPGVVDVEDLHFDNAVPWGGLDHDTSAQALPEEGKYTEQPFTLSNRDIGERVIVRLLNVEAGEGDTSFYNDIWVRLVREDPTGGTALDEVKYYGTLAGLRNVYMGNIVAGGEQAFKVQAWTATPHADPLSIAFTINYSKSSDDLEKEYEKLPVPEDG